MPDPSGGREILRVQEFVKAAVDVAKPLKVALAGGEVKGYELKSAVILILFGTVPLVVFWFHLWRNNSELREWVALNILGLYAFVVIETFSVILLWGFRRLSLPEKFVHWLGVTALGEVAGLAGYMVKKVF